MLHSRDPVGIPQGRSLSSHPPFRLRLTLAFLILVGFALVRIVRREGGAAPRTRVFLALASAVALGVLTTLPVVLDLALAMNRSGRDAVDQRRPGVGHPEQLER